MKNPGAWLMLFLSLSLFYLLSILTTEITVSGQGLLKTLQFIIKPLLVFSLGIYFFTGTASRPGKFRNYILLALVFSVIGDMLMQFAEQRPEFFLFGLFSFLLTHIFYILAFFNFRREQTGYLSRNNWKALPLVLYLLAFDGLLWQDLPAEMLLPVLLYSIVIVTMAAFCLNLRGKLPDKIFRRMITGVFLFMLSDSLIAINRFMGTTLVVPAASFWIMLTYLAGQCLIVTGSARANETLD